MSSFHSPLLAAASALPCARRLAQRSAAAFVLACAIVACDVGEPACGDSILEPPGEMRQFRVLSYNVGNAHKSGPYALRMSDRRYERGLASQIAELSPALVFLQEVLAPNQCEGVDEQDPERSCFDSKNLEPQVRRLLGDAYSIVCDQNRHVECIGVHRTFGAIRGVVAGALDLEGAQTAPMPGRPCDYLRGECTGRGNRCDAESSISMVLIDTVQGPMRAVHVHPTAIGHRCLQRQLWQAFALADEGTPTIMAGDWNFDPSSATDLIPASIWAAWVGQDARFVDHSPRDRTCRPARTSVGQDASLDRVISDFAVGSCRVWSSPRLDDEADKARRAGDRIDHLAVECTLAAWGT
jgi:endonuclease/exonuclease/phosphatase family metal-dependent hydrolase